MSQRYQKINEKRTENTKCVASNDDEKTRLLTDNTCKAEKVLNNENLIGNDQHFKAFVKEVEQAFKEGLHPIPDCGNKGVYSVHTRTQQNIGVFRPKDEELVSTNSSSFNIMRWCLFGCGRTSPKKQLCLLPKQRYLSEVGASIIDRKLGLNIVPKTKIVTLSNKIFRYSDIGGKMAAIKQAINRFLPIFTRTEFSAKIGSLKCYDSFSDINSFVKAPKFLEQHNPIDLPPLRSAALQFEFEKYVVLNYIILNTESYENDWLIKYDENVILCKIETVESVRESVNELLSGLSLENDSEIKTPNLLNTNETEERGISGPQEPQSSANFTNGDNETTNFKSQTKLKAVESDESNPAIKLSMSSEHSEQELPQQPTTSSTNKSAEPKAYRIVAVNVCGGFPFKAQELCDTDVRYAWSRSVLSRTPLSAKIKRLILPKLINKEFSAEIIAEIKQEFERDVDYDEVIFEKQMGIMRGQILNLINALIDDSTPFQLSGKRCRSLSASDFEEKVENLWVNL